MPYLTNSEIDLHIERTGQGQPVLLLAGMASDSASWHPVVQGLAKHGDIIRMDNRCTGRTKPMPVETSRQLLVNDVIELLDTLKIDKVSLVGHSMGALTAWAVAAQAPERINALVAASAPLTVDPTRIDLFNTLARLRTEDNEADWFRLLFQFLFSPRFFADQSQVDDAVNTSMHYPFKQDATSFQQQCLSLPSYLEPIALPDTLPFKALALTGANDRMFSPADLQNSYANFPAVSLHVINDAAHSVHWENPDAFLKIVSEFLFAQ